MARRPRWGSKKLDAAVSDGLAILRFSALMATKNRLIVAALAEGASFDPERARDLAREELAVLAGEQRDNARITTDALASARAKGAGYAQDERDYHAEDAGALATRSRIYRLTAERLDELAQDTEYVDALVEQARAMAWEEIGEAVSARLAGVTVHKDASYELNRELRLRYLVEIDLRLLERRARQDDSQQQAPDGGSV